MTDMNLKEKFVELLDNLNVVDDWYTNGEIAYHLIAHVVTFAEDNNVPSKWISVKDWLPEDGQKVLCFKQGKYAACVMTAAFSKCLEKYCNVDFHGVKHGGFFNYDSEVGYYVLRDVTHWMPLPHPPKGE